MLSQILAGLFRRTNSDSIIKKPLLLVELQRFFFASDMLRVMIYFIKGSLISLDTELTFLLSNSLIPIVILFGW